MDINLINNDIDTFLNKYTRFMTKSIYMTNIIYDRFVSNYRYLYAEVKKNIYLYKDNSKYKKMLSIINDKDQLIKLHNKKYLNELVKDISNDKDKNIIKLLGCEENKLLVMENTKYNDIINGLAEKYKNNILVITDNLDKSIEIKNKENVNIYDIDSLGKNLLNDDYILIKSYDKYRIISNYIKNILYKDKSSFKKFCKVFWNNLYFNKDYLDYDTFRDYHSYMFKRMFLKENTTIDKFNKKMIHKRREYLRTINDELLLSKEEVDIANFLYLNSIHYRYDNQNRCFHIDNGDNFDIIRYMSENDIIDITDDIVLYSKYRDNSKPLEHLVYELIKRRYPMEKLSEEILYNRLKDTCEDGYFSKLLSNTIIPILDNYEDFNKNNVDLDKKMVIRDIYTYYKNYLDNNKLIDRNDMINIIKNRLNDDENYVVLLEGSDKILTKYKFDNIFDKCMIINYDYIEDSFVSNNIKNIYDYKKYLKTQKKIPINNVYINYLEIENITKEFIRINNDSIDKSFDNSKILIYYYDDNKRLMIHKNKGTTMREIMNDIKENILVLGTSLKNRDIIFDSQYFSINSKNEIVSKENNKVKIDYYLFSDKINKIYDYIILDNIMKDKYMDTDTINDLEKRKKIYSYMMKCRNKIIIICPTSKKENMNNLLDKSTILT